MMYSNVLEKIREEERRYGGDLQPPCTENQLEILQQEAKLKLHIDLPESYAAFLRLHNGLNWNGLFIYSAGNTEDFKYDVVEMNLNYRDVDYFNDLLVFGDGNTDIYVYQISANQYQRRDRVPADNIINTYNSFDEMLTEALNIYL